MLFKRIIPEAQKRSSFVPAGSRHTYFFANASLAAKIVRITCLTQYHSENLTTNHSLVPTGRIYMIEGTLRTDSCYIVPRLTNCRICHFCCNSVRFSTNLLMFTNCYTEYMYILNALVMYMTRARCSMNEVLDLKKILIYLKNFCNTSCDQKCVVG